MTDSFLIIQTAFIGDVVLATSLIESLKKHHPNAQIDFLCRKGNEVLLHGNPGIRKILIWDKNQKKIRNLFSLIGQIRKQKYDHVINVQRFFSTGLITALSGGKEKVGFKKNPLSIFFSRAIKHEVDQGLHETDRNHVLISAYGIESKSPPGLYPTEEQYASLKSLQHESYICMAPTSVWFTKQFPAENWVDLIRKVEGYRIYLLGSPEDKVALDRIKELAASSKVENLAGQLNLMESAALIAGAKMTYSNDSAPMHLASAMNAPVTAIYCSTIPEFGFGPLSDNSHVVQKREKLACRPCGLHGRSSCPKGHFKCAVDIQVEDLLHPLD